MKFFKKNLKGITIVVVMMMIVLFLFIKMSLVKNKALDEEKKVTETLEEEKMLFTQEEEETKVEVLKYVHVDIKGAVSNPGVYEIEEKSLVMDVIHLAGGFTEEADSTLINLAKQVTDEMVIIIYTKEEVEEALKNEEAIVKIVDKQCVCPEIKNDACIYNNSDNGNDSNTEKENVETNKNEKVNLNTATLEELQTLDGIGEGKAKAIIEYRETVGLFQTIEDLLKVSGIGQSTYEAIQDNITV